MQKTRSLTVSQNYNYVNIKDMDKLILQPCSPVLSSNREMTGKVPISVLLIISRTWLLELAFGASSPECLSAPGTLED